MRIDPQEGPLPDYTNPPVVEVILGVQFDRLPGFQNAQLGAFWKTLDTNEWPTVIDAPPLESQFESFAESASWAKFAMHLKLTQDPSSRLQIKSKDVLGLGQNCPPPSQIRPVGFRLRARTEIE